MICIGFRVMCGDAGEAHPKLSPPRNVVFADRGSCCGPFDRRCGVGPDYRSRTNLNWKVLDFVRFGDTTQIL